jgi:D-alanyl-D-alanine carboxypeptidase (penicillin-binding protein 5/6)
MSRELLLYHPKIHEYCTIWMENITHTTARGSSEFGLTNTNKLIRQYEYATGLKTGFTQTAGFCVSASARKDDVELIAVIMGGADSKSRFRDAVTLLNSGFACCSIYKDAERPLLQDLTVEGGVAQTVPLQYADDFSYVSTDGSDLSTIQRTADLPEAVEAPVEQGTEVGRMIYSLNGKEIGYTEILAGASVAQAGYGDYMHRMLRSLLL